MALLEVKDLSIGFDTDRGFVHAVRDISFQIEAGQTLGLVGESGSGKSVTGLSLLRLVPQPPGRILSGSIYFDGQDVLALKASALRNVRGKKVGLIFQDPLSALNPVMRVGDQAMESLRVHERISKPAAREHVVKVFVEVGLPDAADKLSAYPHELSGGMRQRVMIAMATILKPMLLIADEPTTALDVTVQAQIVELLRRLREQHSVAVLLISHDIGLVAQLADSIAVMHRGELVEQAPVRELLQQPKHRYSQRLLAAVPRWREQPDG